MRTNTRRIKALRDKELRDKFLADNIKIGLRNQLKSLRDSRDLTQKDLAELINTKQSVIGRLENKPEGVSLPTLLKLASALDVGLVVRFESIDTVIDWYSNPTQKKMTPQRSEVVLKEMERKNAVPRQPTLVINIEGIKKPTQMPPNNSYDYGILDESHIDDSVSDSPFKNIGKQPRKNLDHLALKQPNWGQPLKTGVYQ
jgi:transcriptional regulator with XRE-family HTH domain